MKDELCARGITELKRAYVLVQDLDVPKLSHIFRSQDHRILAFMSTSYQFPHQGNAQTPTYKVDVEDKSVESNAKDKNTERDFSTLSPIVQCYNCQCYAHFAANCLSPVKIIINKLSVTKLESDSEESICQEEEPEDSDSDEKIMIDNLVESNTSSPLEVVPVIIEFTDISRKDSTPIPSEVTPVITKLTDVFPKNSTPNLLEVSLIITESVVFFEDLPGSYH